ncbi:Crotonobetainyl-CoA:carnitine CoA-transferase CaiB [Amphritea atlantica]|uniref:Crotonobetainyl-CoA:carnitine CoA-transferase CaiB n=1 Tax=Amphritea atlantica TaxID=355243 RepID=A0A1H9J1A1_9GAMM|nr:CoA transferase [Amphritea atlantica]SEQ80539.1 Crotonobetainyl-CoA:carnitine CoA-transferase CaiB [Amphritea atlantica]
MSKAFDNIRVIDTTHVLAGPFASYQMAVLGAEVIKVESPEEPDQARMQGSDRSLNDMGMGTAFMAQASNKKTMALDLKTEAGVEAMKRLIQTADVFVENYRPGAFDALGLGYEEMSRLNPGLIYCSISAFGSTGPRREQTAYDAVIQAFSGMMAMTGHGDGKPLKSGAPVVDYATGTTAAYAISAALFQREREGGKGQFIDVSMLDVATILCSSHLTGYLWNGKHPEQKGNVFPFATIGYYHASDAPMMISASNLPQQRRLWTALGREDMIKTDNNQRLDAHAEEAEVLTSIIGTMSADYWEKFLQERGIPAARVRRLEESIADPHIASRKLLHKHDAPDSPVDGLTVPVAGFIMSDSHSEINLPPQPVGAQTAELLQELGYTQEEIDAMQKLGATN